MDKFEKKIKEKPLQEKPLQQSNSFFTRLFDFFFYTPEF